ncbi:hypothetical protein IKF26_01955 [Candidatus Saccharibacteria bacterium]|nr:hypothetical protein [Candidatus Saccharibacteria bacterium]
MAERKSIYKLSIKEMRGLLREFSSTLYGRTIFFLAYFVPLMAFLVMIGLVLAEMIMQSGELFYPIAGTFFLFIGVFILGNIYYYRELRLFSEKK